MFLDTWVGHFRGPGRSISEGGYVLEQGRVVFLMKRATGFGLLGSTGTRNRKASLPLCHCLKNRLAGFVSGNTTSVQSGGMPTNVFLGTPTEK